MKLTTYSDGGARGNPGPMGIGFAIYSEGGELLKKHGEYIGDGTNNHAEYQALTRALTAAHEMGATQLDCYLDSELVVKQLQGKYKIREQNLQTLAAAVLKLTNTFDRVEFHHVMREKNKLADQLVNEALDKAGY